MAAERNIVAYKHYFLSFYKKLPMDAQSKIEWTLQLIKIMKKVPEKYLKHIEGTKGLYEIRVEKAGSTYRIFSFFDKGSLVVLGNAFQLKTEKTPKREIERALE